MLVTFVLRNIVLPHLRSAVRGQVVASERIATTSSHATIATSVRQARASEALVTEREEIRWEPFNVRHHQVPRVHLISRDTSGRGRSLKVEEKDGASVASDSPRRRDHSRPPDSRQRPHLQSPTHSTVQAEEHAPRKLSVADVTPCARSDVPPAIAKLLRAKLYRLTVFQVLDTPEYMADSPLVAYIIHVLEKNGAGKLARRLGKSFDVPTRAADGKIRLLPEPSPTNRRPPDYWRIPLVSRPLDSFPEPTRQERLTHAHNLTISRLLTVTHPIPYSSPVHHTRRAPLRRLRDVLHHVEDLRRNRGFVPDRVTANIIVKAWLNCLARASSRGEPGLGRDDLRDIFHLVSVSFTETNPADGAGLWEPEVGKGGKAKSGKGAEPRPAPDHDATPVFDSRVDYHRHVEPFAKMMVRAMVRVGDHAGRKRVEAWASGMAKKLGVEEGGGKASRVKEE